MKSVKTYAERVTKLEAKKKRPVVMKVFDEVDCRCGHKGLTALAKKSGIDGLGQEIRD